MPSGGGQAGAPETVLAGGGGTARFDGARLRIVRGRTTWTVPVEVPAAAEVTPRGAVRIVLGGTREDAARAGHGLGRAVELPAPDVRAAEAFRRSVATALTHRGPRLTADGHALIDVVREPRSGLRPSRRTRRVLTVSAGAVVYVVLLCLLALEGRLHGERAGLLVFPGGPAGWIGGTLLWRMGRRVHALWLLRGRGVGVAGTVTGRAGTGKGSLWHHSRLTFTTVEGRRPVTDAVSVVSVRAREPGAAVGARAELVYDPERPSRASRPLTAGFALRTLLAAGLGALLTAAFLAGVLAALPR